jgi:hypothetical protein
MSTAIRNAEIAAVSSDGIEQCIDKMASSLADRGDRNA